MARIKYYDPKTNEWTYADSNTIVNLTGYATEIWVQDNYQEKGNYLTEHQDISGKLDADRLPEAISTALAQAKESGVFDGPKGDDYVLTPADKEEIAEIASDLVDISKSNEIYILGAGEDIEDAPASAIMVINPNGDVNMPSTGGNVNQSAKTAFDAFMDNTDVDYAYDNDTGAYYTVIRIYRDRLDGKKQYPFVLFPNDGQNRTTYDLVMQKGYYLAINAGIFHNPRTPDGIVIQNGVVLQNGETTSHPNCKPLTIDGNGTLGYAEYDADANDLVSEGIVSAVVGFMPIVIDYAAVPESEWNSVSHYTSNAQRQIIGQWGCGDYAIITCEGRSNHNSDGWTIAEAQQICMKHGLKFAYNLDGGGSTETMLGKKHINTIYENETGRRVPTFIVFNGKNTFGDAPVVPDNPEPENPEPVETYTTLEYVEFTGTQHINTDIPDSATLGVEAEIVPSEFTFTGGRHFVSGKNSYYVSLVATATPVAKRCGSAETSLGGDVRVTANERYLVRAFVNDDSVKWGDLVVTESMPAGTNAQGNICIGSYAGSPDTATRHLNAKLYALRFYNSGVLSHNFVPSMRSDGAVGLLDTIGNTFYQSSTSTPLVAGNAVDSDEPTVEPDEPTVELLDFDLVEGSVSYKETYIKYWGNHNGAYPKRMQMNPVLVRYDPNYQYTVKMASGDYCMFPHWLTFDNTADTFVVDGTKDVVWSGNGSIVGYQQIDGGGDFIIPACDVFFVHLQRTDTAELTDEDKNWLRNNFTVERVKL